MTIRRSAAEQAPTSVGALPAAFPSDLAVAVRIARTILADYGDSRRDGFSYSAAFGASYEALRLLVRAVADDKRSALVRTPGGDQQRCPAAHPEDPDPCNGAVVVTILDRTNAGADGCEHHGARMLASLEGGRVYPLPHAPEGAAIRVFKAAATTLPYAWVQRGEGQ